MKRRIIIRCRYPLQSQQYRYPSLRQVHHHHRQHRKRNLHSFSEAINHIFLRIMGSRRASLPPFILSQHLLTNHSTNDHAQTRSHPSLPQTFHLCIRQNGSRASSTCLQHHLHRIQHLLQLGPLSVARLFLSIAVITRSACAFPDPDHLSLPLIHICYHPLHLLATVALPAWPVGAQNQ